VNKGISRPSASAGRAKAPCEPAPPFSDEAVSLPTSSQISRGHGVVVVVVAPLVLVSVLVPASVEVEVEDLCFLCLAVVGP
jgi:hypothetical protein